MAATLDLRLLRADAFANGEPYQGPATYWGEFTTTVGTDTTPGTPSGAGRIEIVVADDLALDEAGGADNVTELLSEPADAPLGEQVAFELWTAETGGTRHTVDELETPFTVATGQRIRIQVGALHVQEL